MKTIHSLGLLCFLLCCLLSYFVVTVQCAGVVPVMHLQTIDIVSFSKDGGEWDALLTRQIGVGMDGKPGTKFDASLIDRLPAGIHLLSPDAGAMQVKAVDGSACALTLSEQRAPAIPAVTLAFRGLPKLPEGQKCCDCRACGGKCGRACSVTFSYSTNIVASPGGYGSLQIASSALNIPTGKTTLVEMYITAKPSSLREPAVKITIPDEINGARISVKHYSPALQTVQSAPKLTCFATRKTFHTITVTLELAITPLREGVITLERCAEVGGWAAKSLRAAPIIPNAAKVILEQKTYIRVKKNMEIFAA